MNKKGFTLAELLGVITILAIIAIIAIPSVTLVINKNKEREYNIQIENIKDAVNQYVAENSESLPSAYSLYFTLFQLDNAGVIEMPIKNPKDDSYFAADSVINVKCGDSGCETTFTEEASSPVTDPSQYLQYPKAPATKIIYQSYEEVLEEINHENYFQSPTIKVEENRIRLVINEYQLTMHVPIYYNLVPSIGNTLATKYPDFKLSSNGYCSSTKEYTFSDHGGCYRKGASINDLYVWYSGLKWQIFGFDANNNVELVCLDSPYAFTFQNYRYVLDVLNGPFYNSLENNDIITKSTYRRVPVSKIYMLYNEYVGVLNYALFNSSLDVNKNSFLSSTKNSMTLDIYSDRYFYSYKGSLFYGGVWTGYNVNPLITVDYDTLITDGNGILNNDTNSNDKPYVIGKKLKEQVSSNISNSVTAGEYVKFANNLYRVSSIDKDGNVVIVTDDVYKPNGVEYQMGLQDSSSNFVGDNLLKTTVYDNLVPNEDDRAKIVIDAKWNTREYAYSENENIAGDIVGTVVDTYVSPVGLLNFFERGSGMSYSAETGYVTASFVNTGSNTMFRYLSDTSYIINRTQADDPSSVKYNIRPTLLIKGSTKIISGDGTQNNPYQL